ncbi:hypothetical protein MSIMFI_04892 [Mycobacterium simulans]|nr:hypothetical protein MSIMFI_04892 [Mycobacterium simulans]
MSSLHGHVVPAAAVFLAFDQARYLTDIQLIVDAGLSAKA